eukprot:CAMPEP_0174288608 /NCGR_PEP_ID=MMETSP0809-20121228/21550_1 /TAXON_ID=73025 ORGANISM="Eutreptiella gymnastica-like, Strain CCMP1594" /NCGR_SAMPLE_ID=MMETSP0809 /ASSEMBLY_ACC=CAM_ASM_000658 /LENGTH=97 /DNA_ID=CAMNT_0015385957 /DNA_START=609 /DNA_END=899 /DNA_ORIENTATION=+
MWRTSNRCCMHPNPGGRGLPSTGYWAPCAHTRRAVIGGGVASTTKGTVEYQHGPHHKDHQHRTGHKECPGVDVGDRGLLAPRAPRNVLEQTMGKRAF